MKRNYKWGTVNELIMLGMLSNINVSYMNAADKDQSKLVITDVYTENTLDITSNLIFDAKSFIGYFIASIYLDPLLTIMMLYMGFISF